MSSLPTNPDPIDLVSLAGAANHEHQAACHDASKAVEHGCLCGESLIKAKQQVGHGRWQSWLADNFAGSARTARAYMQLADGREQIAKTADSATLSIDSALKLLRGTSTTQKSQEQETDAISLPSPVQLYLKAGAINEGHAWQLLRLKDIYGGLTVDFTGWKDPSAEFEFKDATEVWSLLHQCLRPEDWPISVFQKLLKDEADPGILSAGCTAFLEYVREHDFVVPQWHVAAFWWASLVACESKLTPVLLTDSITEWHERFLSAVAFLATHKEEPQPVEDQSDHGRFRMQQMEWYGHRSDLRHSNALAIIEKPRHDRMLFALEWAITHDTICPPSSCQPWAPNGQKYHRLFEMHMGTQT
jgi:hypothetical protein